MSNPEAMHPAFDAEEQAILSAIKPEDEAVDDAPDGGQPAEPQGSAQTPAAAEQPAPAATTEATQAAPAQPGALAAASTEQAAATAPATQAPTQAAATPPEKPQGDTRAALRASRQAEKRLRNELERTQQELADLRAGKAPADTSVSEEELAEMDNDIPLVAKVARQNQELQRQFQELTQRQATQQGTEEFQPLAYPPQVQELIDEVPDLLNWQHDPAAQDKFQRAVAYDDALRADPDWKTKSAVERFEEAARRTRRAFGLPLEPTQPSPTGATPTPTTTPTAPPSLEQIPVTTPKGISDFRGGAPATAPTLDYSRMSDEAILASLPQQE